MRVETATAPSGRVVLSGAKRLKCRPRRPTAEDEAECERLRADILRRILAMNREDEEARIGGPVPPDWDGTVGRDDPDPRS
jgi:hypothetical protein